MNSSSGRPATQRRDVEYGYKTEPLSSGGVMWVTVESHSLWPEKAPTKHQHMTLPSGGLNSFSLKLILFPPPPRQHGLSSHRHKHARTRAHTHSHIRQYLWLSGSLNTFHTLSQVTEVQTISICIMSFSYESEEPQLKSDHKFSRSLMFQDFKSRVKTGLHTVNSQLSSLSSLATITDSICGASAS